MGTTIGIIGLFVAIALLVVLAFKGHSVIIAAPIAALIAVLFSYGLKGHFMASYTITYMSGFANYAKNYFPIYLFGAVFAKLMDISGNAQSIAQFCTLKGSEYHSNDLFWNRLLGSTCPWYHCNCYYVWRWHGMAVLPY